jgi:hypothetical protein
VGAVCCHVEVSASEWSIVQRSLTECGVSECDREASTRRRPLLTRFVESLKTVADTVEIRRGVAAVVKEYLYRVLL